MLSFLRGVVLGLSLIPSMSAATKIARGGAMDMQHNTHHEIGSDIIGPVKVPQSELHPVHVHVQNRVGTPLHAVFVNSAGSPSLGDSRIVYDQTSFTVPEHAAGQVTFGHNDNPLGSKVEFSNGFQVAATQIYMDISYVDGFSVPIICHCGGITTGCAKPLFRRHRCQHLELGPVCVNDAPDNGPAQPFFQPCRNGAYTYAYQAGMGTGTYCQGDRIECCIGAACRE